MKNTIFFVALVALTQMAFGQAGPGAIFQGPNILQLKQNIIFKDSSVKIMTGDTDAPDAVAKDAVQGSLYVRSGTGTLYQKQDNGLSVNWLPLLIGPAASGTDECVVRWNGTGSPLLQDSLLCITDAGVATGLTQFNLENLRLDGNTASSTSGDFVIDPAGNLNLPDATPSRLLKTDASRNVVSGKVDVTDTNDVQGLGSAGSIPYSNGTVFAFSGVCTSGQIWQSGGTGAPTCFSGTGYMTSAAGIPSASYGTGNQIAGMNNAGNANEFKSITATASQTTVTHSVGGIAIGTVQNIATTSTPTFGGLTLTGLSGVVKATAGVLSAGLVNLASEVTGLLPGANMTPMVGATGVANGTQGAVPQPLIANQLQFLRGDGTYATPSGTGVATIGTIDSQTKSANGAVITGTSLVMQTASSTFVGLVDIIAQSFKGLKTFVDGIVDSTLTAGRCMFVGTSGRLSDDAGCAYNSATDSLTLLGQMSSASVATSGDITAGTNVTGSRVVANGVAEGSLPCNLMTTAQRVASVQNVGSCVYDTTLKTQFIWDGSNWAIQGVQPAIESGTFTPTGSWTGGNVTYTGKYWINGPMATYEYKIALTGAPTGGTLTLNTPHTIDTAAMTDTTGNAPMLNLGSNLIDTGTTSYDVSIRYVSSTSIGLIIKGASGTYVTNQSIVDATTPFTFGNTDAVVVRVMVPIIGRSAGVSTYSVASSGAAQIKWANVSNCAPSTTSATFADLVDTDCTFASATTSGPVATPTATGGIALKRSTSMSAGKYRVGFSGAMSAGAATSCSFQLTDGTNTIGPVRVEADALASAKSFLGGIPGTIVTYSTSSTPEWKVQAKRLSGAGNCGIDSDSANSSMAITMEPVDEIITASFGNTPQMAGAGATGKLCNFGFGSGTNYRDRCTSGPCTLYKNTMGACASGVARTGTGVYDVTFVGGTWTSADSYSCSLQVTDQSQNSTVCVPGGTSQTSTVLHMACAGATAGASDVALLLNCSGY